MKTSYRLKESGWHDEDEDLIYFVIVDDNLKTVWCSSLFDVREFSEFQDTIENLRSQVLNACQKYDIPIDCSSNDFDDWIKE